MYAIVDIETTGLSPKKERITEVAIYVFDGKKVVDEFISLVNPERPIPYFITRMTGITNEMVEDAPKFYEVAKRIIVDRARLYNPKSSGSNNLAIMIVNKREPIFATKVVEN